MYRCGQIDRIFVTKKLLLSLIVLFIPSLSAFGQSPNYGSGFTSSGLTFNSGAAINGTRLRLTDGGTAEARTAFFNTPVNAQSFTNDFTFQLTNANADGFTFTIQGNGPTAVGLGGGSLGYGQNSSGTGGIPNSVAVGFQLYSTVLGNKPVSLTGVWTNGASPAATPGSDTSASGVNLHSGHAMSVHMTYDGTTLTWTITDSTAGKSFTKSVTINIPSFTGNTAYVGFTGGTGGITSIQDILTWTYTPNSTSPVPPSITTQPKNQTVIAGQKATFSVVASGTAPLSYQWRENGTSIPGAISSSYTTPATTSGDNGSTFQVVVTNSVSSATSNSATLTVNSSAPGVNYGGGFTSSGLTLNGGAAISGTNLRLTDGGTAESRSAFFSSPVNAQSFTNDFTFQLTSANADGFTFTIQGNNASALGLGGGSLGYGQNSSGTGGIPNSVAVGFQLYSTVLGNKPVSLTGVWTNGASPAATPGSDTTASGVNLHSGDVMSVHMTYDGTTLIWTITDSTVGKSFTKSVTIDIPSFTGNTAYVGFTGGTGGVTAIQDIRSWTYTSPMNTQEVAMPTFSPGAGTYSSPQSVTISDTTTGATIFYTTDGSTPTTSSTRYTGPITVNSTTTIEAIATASGMTNSTVATATYTIQAAGGGGFPAFGSGFTSSGLTLNGGAAISGSRLRLTDGGATEARSAFFSTLVNVQSFITDFKFQQTNANADGFTFAIQGNSPSAVGSGGGSLGYGPSTSSGGIGNSIAVKFDLFSNSGEGSNSTGLYTNGSSPTLPSIDLSGSGINLHSAHVMSAHIAYDGTTLTLIITDTSTNASFRASFSVNIPSIVGGNSAYVGFTGGTGGLTATQDILTWRYNSVPVAAFTWPVATPITYAASECGPPNDYSTYCSQTPIFGQYHTGIDVCPQSPGCAIGNPVSAASTGIVELALVVSDASQTLCDGSATTGYQVNPSTSNLGNVIVIAHPNGKFTLYGHLDCIWPGVIPGMQVSAGTRIGNMGHSGDGQRNRTFTPHTHFELKDRAVTGDSTNKGYSGYTTDVPEGYGYHDARISINPFSTSAVSPTAIKVVASSAQNVFTGPATSFASLLSVAPGQEFVAFATSGSWYQIYLPNDNAPISGWVQGGPNLVTTDPSAAQLQVTGAAASGLTIQPGPSSSTNLLSWNQTFGNCTPPAKIWNGQRYVSLGTQSGFNQFYLPLNYYFSSANACAEPTVPGPSTGWANSTFVTVTTSGGGTLAITTNSLPNGQVSSAYSATLAATGGTTPYIWSLTSGTLPAGLSLNASTGAITGTPTQTVSNTPLTFQVTDSVSNKQSVNLTLTINASGAIAVSVSPKRGALTVAQTLPVTATTNGPGVTWTATGGSFDSNSSTSGVPVTFTPPATAGSYTITATSTTDATASASLTVGVTDLAGVFTYHNDLSRDGANTQEYALAPSLVNTSTFAKLFSCSADGAIYAQPLWVPNVSIGVPVGKHNVIIAATMRDSVYAFDADASPCVTYWHMTLIPSGETYGNNSDVNSADIKPDIGILGTPVIDGSAGTIYLVTKTKTTAGTYHQRLHALSLSDGSERTNSPVEIDSSISVPGNCEGGSSVSFDPLRENQRPGLALVNGVVYVSWASHGDTDPYHGWIIGYSASNLNRVAVYNTSPNKTNVTTCRAGIWMSGGAPAADFSNNVYHLYVLTGNGIWNGTDAWGDSALKLGTSGGLSVTDWFTPWNQSTLDQGDIDVGSGGAALLVDSSGPHSQLLIGGGKIFGTNGVLYILDRTNMGHIHASDNSQIVQTLTVTGGTFSTPAFWQNTLFHFGTNTTGKTYAFNSSTSTFNALSTSQTAASFGKRGATPSVSSSGNSNGILWVIDASNYGTSTTPAAGPAVLHAYDATNLGTELWNSSMVAGDKAGNAVKFTVPSVANGKVYIGTRGNDNANGSGTIFGEIDVYGLKPN